jgi:hypothetical protein
MRLAAFIILAAAAAYAQDSRLDLRQTLQIAETDNLELKAARQQRAMALAGATTGRSNTQSDNQLRRCARHPT